MPFKINEDWEVSSYRSAMRAMEAYKEASDDEFYQFEDLSACEAFTPQLTEAQVKSFFETFANTPGTFFIKEHHPESQLYQALRQSAEHFIKDEKLTIEEIFVTPKSKYMRSIP